MRVPIHLRVAGSYAGVAAVSLLIGGTVVEKRVAARAGAEISQRLMQDAKLLRAELVEHPIAEQDADPWADGRGTTLSAQVTLIADDGRVLGDSELSPEQVRTIENQSSLPEMVDARARDIGQSQRFASPAQQQMLYVAVKHPHGFVRVAMPLDGVAASVALVRKSVMLALVLALASAAVVSYLAARRVTHPIEMITERALEMARGRFEGRLRRAGHHEVAELADAMNRLAQDVDAHVTGLREEGARLRAVLDGMAEGVMVTDDDGRIALWNESFGRLFPGIPPAGRRPIEVVRSAELQDAIRDAEDDPAPVARELPLGERTFIVRVARIRREAGPSERIVAVFNDVTEMRRGERMRRDFVANASHELRTPIATVRAAAETILAIGDSLPDAARRFSEMIFRQSQRMGQLVDDMLHLSELESSYRPTAEVVDMTLLVEQVLSAARARAGQRTLKLEQQVARGISALADPAAVEQILTNLVDNACKYTPDGGRIQVHAHAQDGQVILEVRDSGPGISREHLPRLFERFYRVDSGRARQHGGTGLGLAIVKHLAVANRGEVSVQSEIGRGSIFTVKLPHAEE